MSVLVMLSHLKWFWNIIIYLCVENKLCKHAAVIIYLRQLFEWLTSDVAIWCQCFQFNSTVRWCCWVWPCHVAVVVIVYAICQSLSVCLCVFKNDWLPIQVQCELVNAVGNAQKISQTTLFVHIEFRPYFIVVRISLMANRLNCCSIEAADMEWRNG